MSIAEIEKTLLTLDGWGIEKKRAALRELIQIEKRAALNKMKDYFAQDAFYSESSGAGKISVAIEEYINQGNY